MNNIFISYCHENKIWEERLATQLNVLKIQGKLNFWDDQQLRGGDNWPAKLEQVLNEVNIAILLISAEFLNSKFILEKEVPVLLKRRKQANLRIVPLIIEPCLWQEVDWLRDIHVRPNDGQPLSSMKTEQAKEALVSLVKEIIEPEDRKDIKSTQEKSHNEDSQTMNGNKGIGKEPAGNPLIIRSPVENNRIKLIVFLIMAVIVLVVILIQSNLIPKPNGQINKVTVTPIIRATPTVNPTQKIVFSLSTQPRDFRLYDSSRANRIYANFKTSAPIQKLEMDWGENGEGYIGVENFRNFSTKEGGWYYYSIIHKFQELGLKEIKARVYLEGESNPHPISRQFEIEVIN